MGNLDKSAVIQSLYERLDNKKSKCKICNLESKHLQNMKRHIRIKHAKVLLRKSGKGKTPRSRQDPELCRKTEPFIEHLGRQKSKTDPTKSFTGAKCRLCSKTARIDRIRTHVAEAHSDQINTEDAIKQAVVKDIPSRQQGAKITKTEQ